ncbi:MAG: hypothetical protein EXR94_03805 [Gemmatimonadetes bacterium]|nr:hypothetical protein [Gemmatimonadota bacterium]
MPQPLIRLVGVLIAALPLQVQTAVALFTVPWIMRGPELVGREPGNVRWPPDGQWIHVSWLPPGESWRENPRPYRVRAVPGAAPERLTVRPADSVAPLRADGITSRDRQWRVVSVRGDLFLAALPQGTIRRLTETPGPQEVDPSFDATGTRVFFRRDQNLFAFKDYGFVRPDSWADEYRRILDLFEKTLPRR